MVGSSSAPPRHAPLPVFEVEAPLPIERALQAVLFPAWEIMRLVFVQDEPQPYKESMA